MHDAHALYLQTQPYSKKKHVSQAQSGNTVWFPPICYSNIHSTDCIRAYYVPGTLTGNRDTAMNETGASSK